MWNVFACLMICIRNKVFQWTLIAKVKTIIYTGPNLEIKLFYFDLGTTWFWKVWRQDFRLPSISHDFWREGTRNFFNHYRKAKGAVVFKNHLSRDSYRHLRFSLFLFDVISQGTIIFSLGSLWSLNVPIRKKYNKVIFK